MKKSLTFTFITLFVFLNLYAQTPPNVSPIIPIDNNASMSGNQGTFNNVAEIQAGFNHAKRIEDGQFCLAQNSISVSEPPPTPPDFQATDRHSFRF